MELSLKIFGWLVSRPVATGTICRATEKMKNLREKEVP